MQPRGNDETARPVNPLLIKACHKGIPEGFVLQRQVFSCNIDKLRKKEREEHGDNVIVEGGHYKIFKIRAGVFDVRFYPQGCRIFVKPAKAVPEMTFVLNGKPVKAGPPDYSNECSCCFSKPVVTPGSYCPDCTWGDPEMTKKYLGKS